MKARNLLSILFAVGMLWLANAAQGQPVQIGNARLQSLTVAGGLEGEFRAMVGRQSEAAWIGYAVPLVEGEHSMCCSHSSSLGTCTGCNLENERNNITNTHSPEKILLESPKNAVILFRIAHGEVEKIRIFSEDCQLDAGGLPVYWLTGVRPADSLSLLQTFVPAAGSQERKRSELEESAISAVAFHRDPDADRIMSRWIEPHQPESIREHTTFWLGVTRGRSGYELLRRLVHDDPSPKIREKAIFALSLSKEPEAISTMVEVARNDQTPHVRGQALFWLAQKAGKKAVGVITTAIENDPETEVKKKAVFALSQLPKEEGVPRLIEVAQNNKNPVVRKQALFWLGQSNDPRALQLFEKILTH